MKRREFITLLGGTALTWPLGLSAQQQRRIGVLMDLEEGDPEIKNDLAAFKETLGSLGWVDGQTIQVAYRAALDPEGLRSRASELLNLAPDLMVTYNTPATNAVRQASPSMPIVFMGSSDPRFVKSLARPGGNVTGFTNFEETMGGKWLDLLRQIAPSVSRASMLFNPETANSGTRGGIFLRSIVSAAHATSTELVVSPVHDPAGIDDVFAAMAQGSKGGVMVMPNAFTLAHREPSSRRRRGIECRRSIHSFNSLHLGGCCPTGSTPWTSSAVPRHTLIGS